MVLFKALLSGLASYAGFRFYLSSLKLPPELTYTFEEYCVSKGYNVQTHWVTTDDGYILRLFRLSSKNKDFVKGKTPVLMVHGLTHNAISYVIAQKSNPPAFVLADENFDVWLLNTRGNHLSRQHKTLKSSQPEYWEWCANHIGLFDIPATIDYVLKQTEKPKLNYIGHSQGCYVALQCLSFKPEYGDKVNVAALMAPVAGVLKTEAQYMKKLFNPWYQKYLNYKGVSSVANYSESPNLSSRISYAFPKFGAWRYRDRLDMYIHKDDITDLPLYLQKFSGGTSMMNIKYWAQLRNERLALPHSYDYGEKKNIEVYGTSQPPQMQLSNIRCKLGLLYGKYDNILMKEDQEMSVPEMPKDKIVFLKDDYEQDHAGFAVSKDQSHMQDILELFKKYPIN